MNALSFFTREQFERIKEMAEREEILCPNGTPFRKAVKENGNTYEISIFTGRYTFPDAEGDFYICGIYDFNHKSNISAERQLYGGTFSINAEDLSDYENFASRLNNLLLRTPDYTVEEQPIQYTLF